MTLTYPGPLFSPPPSLILHNHKANSLLTLGHLLTSAFCLRILKAAGLVELPPCTFAVVKRTLPLSLVFVLNILVGTVAIRLVNIPIFTYFFFRCIFLIFSKKW